jgi:hypothetical protein
MYNKENLIPTDSSSVSDPHHFNANVDPAFHFNVDPDPALHFNADPDPATHQSNTNLQPLATRPFRPPF